MPLFAYQKQRPIIIVRILHITPEINMNQIIYIDLTILFD